MVNLLTVAECQIGLQVYLYAFTCSGQHFFFRIICNDIKPQRSDSVSTDLDITDTSRSIAMVMIQDIPADKHKLLFIRIPFLWVGNRHVTKG